MKKFRSYIYYLMFLSFSVLVGCYQPIANTSGALDNDSEIVRKNDNTSVESINRSESNNSSANDNNSGKGKMKESGKEDTAKTAGGFHGHLNQNLSRNGLTVTEIYDPSNLVEKRILQEYGSVFLTKAVPPSKTMFTSEQEVAEFQTKAGVASANIGGTNIELQNDAMQALKEAVDEAKKAGLKITPRDGAEAARRSFEKTLTLWNSRFEPALKHWKAKGRLSDEQISRLKSLSIKEQVAEVLKLEEKGIYFNTFFNGSILHSVAAPGTSQHLSMLAFDATEFTNKKVREILAKHGWFRTVQNDEPHFTYLGYQESDLPNLGLKKVIKKDGEFWIPNI